ncbi:hypothetical protein Tco_0895465 [Tanacetum coccineum]|uniref:Uncharacterized protein n=1 Tax=Tanacetum coccineum TaxID=301880 RepID=A0ABQ5CHX1_9ASTR
MTITLHKDTANGYKELNADDAPEQNWFNEMMNVEKDPDTFGDLMGSTIDFTKFAKHCLKKDKLTKADLEGPAFKLLKGNYQNYIKLEYNMEYIIRISMGKQFGYGYLKEIVVQRANQKECVFKEADFPKLHLNDIEVMYLLYAQNKLYHIIGDEQLDLVTPLCLFIRRIVLKKRVEDIQLRVKSYQTKLNITRPQVRCVDLNVKEPYTILYKRRGVVYLNKNNGKYLMRDDELYKFSDRMLKPVRDILNTRLYNFVIAVGDLREPIWIKLVSSGYRFGPVYELTTQSLATLSRRFFESTYSQSQSVQVNAYQGRLLDSFQDEEMYKHVGPKTQERKKAKNHKDNQVMIKSQDLKMKKIMLFNLDLQKDASVAQKFQNPDFAVSFRRRPRGGIEESQF